MSYLINQLQSEIDFLEKEIIVIKQASLDMCRELYRLKKEFSMFMTGIEDYPSDSDDED
jgi:hypothetical protein